MTEADAIETLGARIGQGTATIDEICEFIGLLIPDAVSAVNGTFAPRQLAKQDRVTEPLPTNTRQLSSYRTRIGTMLEYALSTALDAMIAARFGAALRLTFAVAHEYPDFYMRDAELVPQVRIEMKAVDADSDEQAARFSVLEGLIKGEKDVVILVGWQWQSATLDTGISYEYPFIFSFVVVPAAELAGERDRSVVLRGGRVDPDAIRVPSKTKKGELTADKGNAGKILRLVHQSRKADAFSLSGHIQRYVQFVERIAEEAKTTRSTPKRRG